MIAEGQVPEGLEAICVEVWIAQDEHGRILSSHRTRPEYEDIAQKWKGQGIEQRTFALVTEAVREEAFLQAMLKMSRDPAFLAKIDDDQYQHLAGELQLVLSKMIAQVAEQAVREQVAVMLEAIKPPTF